MKIRNKIILITALCLAVFALGSCDYWEPADQGSINISFDDSNARTATVLDGDKPNMIYTITLTSPGKGTITRTTEKGEAFISIPVPGGTWNIQVHGEGERRIGEGTSYVAVTPGKPASAFIKMNVTGTKANSYEQIVEDFKDNSLPSEFVINVLASKITAHSSTDRPGASANDSLNIAILSNGKTITLRAKAKSLLINREFITNSIDSNVFRIKNGSLILDGETDGEITINGIRNELNENQISCTRALINVEGVSSTLTTLGNVTITNNTTDKGGGIFVKEGTFIMKGGTIFGNYASISGGGVHIEYGGYFIKSGGIVYGNGNDVEEKNKNISDKGAAVFCSGSTPVDTTLNDGNKNYHATNN